MDTVKSYELPFIRCFNCNKPLGHLYDEYYNLLEMIPPHPNRHVEIFDILNIKNGCCREKMTHPEIIVINKPDQYAILDIKPEVIENKLKPNEKLSKIPIKEERKMIKTDYKSGIPFQYTVNNKRHYLNDEIYVYYVDHSTYLAQ